jgi:hypothetical protein
MGYDLTSCGPCVPASQQRDLRVLLGLPAPEGEDLWRFRWNIYHWPKLLKLAGQFGWELGENWVDRYCSNDFLVTAEDARNLADALERALPDIPNEQVCAVKKIDLPGGMTCTAFEGEPPENPLELFSGERKQYLREFIAFCRNGAFRID